MYEKHNENNMKNGLIYLYLTNVIQTSRWISYGVVIDGSNGSIKIINLNNKNINEWSTSKVFNFFSK